MIDTHCHLTYPGLVERLEHVLADAKAKGVHSMVSIGTSVADSIHAASLADRLPGVWSTAGVHPGHAHEVEDLDAMTHALEALLTRPRVVALGECGMDFHYGKTHENAQRRVFEAQLNIAATQHRLPVVIHNRDATDATLGLIQDSGIDPQRLLFHCYTGSASELERLLDLGVWVGFTGIVTFKSAQDLAALSDTVPLERLMIETDAPYLTPHPHRKVKINEPKYVADVATFLAQRRGLSRLAFTQATDANAQQFYGLDGLHAPSA